MVTSTSYMEAMNMPVSEIMAMCDAINEISEERKKLMDELNKNK